MNQHVIDFFAAMGFAISNPLLTGLGGDALKWFWMVLAAVGLAWSFGMAAQDEEGIMIPIKQVICVVISAFLLYGIVKVDLPEFSYVAKGRLEAEAGFNQGAALLPTYATFKVGRALMVSSRGLLRKGEATSVPNAALRAGLMTSDADVLDDPQLRANLVAWNEVVAPFLLKQDPALERSLRESGVIDEFLIPTPTARDYVGSSADRAQKVQALLQKTNVQIGDMLCSVGTFVEQRMSKGGAASWTGETGMCTDTAIKLNLVATAKSPASNWSLFGSSPNVAWAKGTAFTQGMMNVSGVSTDTITVTSVSELYGKIAQSVLYVAGNRYAADSDRVVLLGTACDKLSSEVGGASCHATQYGLVGAAKGVVAAEGYKGPDDDRSMGAKAGDFLYGLLGYGTTSFFRMFVALLSGAVQSFLPYAMGIAICVSLIISAIGLYRLLWPRNFTIAMGWMVGPMLFSSLWVVLNGLWTEIDVWLMLMVAVISGFFSDESAFGTNITGIVTSVGYLAIPFLTWSIIYGSAGKALSRATNFSQRMAEAGAAIAVVAARLGIGGLNALNKSSSTPTSSGGSPGSGGGSGGGGSPAGAPPSSAPPSGSSGSNTGRSSGQSTGSSGSPKAAPPSTSSPGAHPSTPGGTGSSAPPTSSGLGPTPGATGSPPPPQAPFGGAPGSTMPPGGTPPSASPTGNRSAPSGSAPPTSAAGSGTASGSSAPKFTPIP